MEPIVDLSDTGKRRLCQRAPYRNYAQYLKFSGIRINCSDNGSSCCRMQSDLCLINLPYWWWDNIILFLVQALVELAYLILIMLRDEHA